MTSTTEAFNTSTDQLLDAYNATYAPLYSSSNKLRVSAAGRVYGITENVLPIVRLITLDPSSGDFTLTLNLKCLSNVASQLRIRFCANASDQACYQILGNSDASMTITTLNTSGTVTTTHATTTWDDSVDTTVVITRVGDAFVVKFNGTTKASWSSSALANGICVFGVSRNFGDPSSSIGIHLDQVNCGAPGQICPGIISLSSIGGSSASFATTAATRGAGAMTYQLQRTTDLTGATGWANVGSSGSGLTATDSTVVGGTSYAWRFEITDGTNTDYTGFVTGLCVNTTTFAVSANGVQFIGRTADSGGVRTLVSANGEIWFRIFGNVLKLNYKSGGTTPIYVSVDGGAWYTPTGSPFVNTAGAVAKSGNILTSSPTDAAHDIRIRTVNGFANSFGLRLTDGIEVTSGGTPTCAAHSDFGALELLRGTNALAYWHETFGDTNAAGTGFTSPIFPSSKNTGCQCPARGAYAEFLVDSSTTKIYCYTDNNSEKFSIWVSESAESNLVRQSIQTLPSSGTAGTLGMCGPYTIPGSGRRRVRVSNLPSLDSVIVNGAFIAESVNPPTTKVVWYGDSVTASNSAVTGSNDGVDDENDASGSWVHLSQLMLQNCKIYNRGLDGDWAAQTNSNSRIASDLTPLAPDFVVMNMGVNDGSLFASSPATTQASYVTMLNAILTNNPTATIYVVPPLVANTANRTAIVTGISAAVSSIGSPRCIFYDSAAWEMTAGEMSGNHPWSIGYAQGMGGGVAVIKITSNPSDGDTVTINGTVFEFDSNASVTGGNISVTIGATYVDTITNLGNAITAQSAAYRLLERLIIPTNLSHQGLVIRGCTSLTKSSTPVTVYRPTTGWLDVLNLMLTPAGSSYKNMLLLGVG